MKTRGLIAGAFALALGLSASADAWFDAQINTYTEWPNEVATGGAWSNTDGATLAGEAPAAKLVVDAEDDAALTFAATQSKAIGDGVTINSTVTFNAFDSLPTVPADAKAALIAVKNESAYDIYGLVQDGNNPANTWAKLFAGQTDIEDVAVSINLVRANSATTVTYTFDETPAAARTVYTVDDASSIVQGAAFSGCGEVAALAAEYVVPMCTLTCGTLGEHDDYLSIASVKSEDGETEYWNAGDSNAKIPVGTKVKIYFAIDPNAAKVFTGNNWIEKEITSAEPVVIGAADITDITIEPAEAAIGTTYYLTFDDANKAAEPTDTITLLANVEIAEGTYTVNAEAIETDVYTITLMDETSEFVFADDGALLTAEAILLAESLQDDFTLEYDEEAGRYKPVANGTVFTIVKGEGVAEITVTCDEDPVEIKGGKITVDPNGYTTFVITPTSGFTNPEYKGTGVTWDSVEGDTFMVFNGNYTEGATITFTVEEGQSEGVIFTLTATGIEGAPTYKIGAAEPVDFEAGEAANQWVATVPPSEVFTVGYTVDSGIAIPVATWTTDLAHNGNVITMGEIDGAATLAITDAKDAPKDDPNAQKAAEDAIIASVDPEDREAVAAQIAVLKANCSAKPSEIAGWIEENNFQGADLATAKAIDVSYDFGMNELFQEEAKAEVTAFAADAVADNTYVFEVQLMDGDEPLAVTKAVNDTVAKIVQASSDVADFTTEAKKLTPTITDAAVSEGKLTFKVGLPDGAEKAFMRIAK